MKKGIFFTKGGSLNNQEKFRKKVEKIVKTERNKRNFLPLFSGKYPCKLSEQQRKNKMMEIAQKYFEIKEKIDINTDSRYGNYDAFSVCLCLFLGF